MRIYVYTKENGMSKQVVSTLGSVTSAWALPSVLTTYYCILQEWITAMCYISFVALKCVALI